MNTALFFEAGMICSIYWQHKNKKYKKLFVHAPQPKTQSDDNKKGGENFDQFIFQKTTFKHHKSEQSKMSCTDNGADRAFISAVLKYSNSRADALC